MLSRQKYHSVTILLIAAPAFLLGSGSATAQSARGQQRLNALQQQTAFQQQQNAVQTALQQTTTLLQTAYQQNGVTQQAGTPNLPNLQQQENALQIAIQQTTALLQASYRVESNTSQMALQQLNTLQYVFQQSISLQSQLPVANSPLSTFQQQTLAQELNSLMGLLSAQLPLSSRKRHPR